jgi:uncharacterized protein (DUF302 family)
MKPPTIFLSSTIYDFKDLRSALKFYLEEQGCTVLASEYNDFLKPLDKHSYEACLQAIERADYYVLLIGTRVGGWFDPEQRISITQQEYRHAYGLQKAAKLKIITFVRTEVWQSREERKELASYLASLPYSDAEKKRFEAYPSKFADDAEFIDAFINEVGRNRETATALKAGTPLPSGNWIHVFRDFREVIATVQAQILSGVPVAEAALRRLLQSETREVLRRCIPKSRNNVFSPRIVVEAFLRKYPLTIENRDADYLDIDTADWDGLTWYAYHLIAVQFHPTILDTAVLSPFFLTFNPANNAFEETPFHRAIIALRDQIRRFNDSNTSETLSVVYEHSPKQRLHRNGTVTVEPQKIATLLHLFDRWINIIELCIAIYRHLDGKPFVDPSLRSRSPVEGMAEKIEAESPTVDEAIAFINFDHEAYRKAVSSQ